MYSSCLLGLSSVRPNTYVEEELPWTDQHKHQWKCYTLGAQSKHKQAVTSEAKLDSADVFAGSSEAGASIDSNRPNGKVGACMLAATVSNDASR